MQKKLVLVGGPMGVGKSAVCRSLYKRLHKAVWLDGDWCWMMNPWNFCEENRRMVEDNIVFLLRNFLLNSTFDYVIFDWVLHREEIVSTILDRLSEAEYRLYRVVLVCSERELRARMTRDHRDDISIESSVARLGMFLATNALTIDTTDLGVEETAGRIEAVLLKETTPQP